MSEKVEQVKKKHPNKTRIILIIAVIIISLIIGIIYYLYSHLVLSKYEETENAYVNGNIVTVTSEIRGTVTAIYTNDTKCVNEGDILIKLNDQDAEIALEKAKSVLGNTTRQLRELYANVSQYKAILKQQKIALEKAEKDYNRRIPLAAKNIISQEELFHAKTAVMSAKAALDVTIKQEAIANASIDGISLENHPKLLQAKADFIEAWLNLKRTTILAPISGYVAKKNVQVGSMVSPGVPLLSVISLDKLWIDANLKETQLKNIRINQDATIVTDVYGSNVVYHGKVVGLSAGTGSAFSLLPAQNATGNWIKIVQRVPVRIALDPKELKDNPLRIGLSAHVKIDISNKSGEGLYKLNKSSSTTTTTVITKDLSEAENIANKIINSNTKSSQSTKILNIHDSKESTNKNKNKNKNKKHLIKN